MADSPMEKDSPDKIIIIGAGTGTPPSIFKIINDMDGYTAREAVPSDYLVMEAPLQRMVQNLESVKHIFSDGEILESTKPEVIFISGKLRWTIDDLLRNTIDIGPAIGGLCYRVRKQYLVTTKINGVRNRKKALMSRATLVLQHRFLSIY